MSEYRTLAFCCKEDEYHELASEAKSRGTSIASLLRHFCHIGRLSETADDKRRFKTEIEAANDKKRLYQFGYSAKEQDDVCTNQR